MIFALGMMSPVIEKAVEMTGQQTKIVYVKMTKDEAIPAGGIDFLELIETKGEI